MKLIRIFLFFAMFLAVLPARAQSVLDNLPPAITQGDQDDDEAMPIKEQKDQTSPAPLVPAQPENYTIMDVNADVTADTASHARDQALMMAERMALTQLCTRTNMPDMSAKLNDDAVAALVQSFEVQSEKLSSVRYIGVFTISFKASAVQALQKKNVRPASMTLPSTSSADVAKPAPTGPVTHMHVAVQAETLAVWTQIKKRINLAPQVTGIQVESLARGASHIDLSYVGSIPDLQQALTAQGLVLHQVSGNWEIYDGSMTPR